MGRESDSDWGILFFIVVFSFVAIILFLGSNYDITTGAIIVKDSVTEERAIKIAESYVNGILDKQMSEKYDNWRDYYSIATEWVYKEKHIWYVRVRVSPNIESNSGGEVITVKVSARTGTVL